MDLRRWVYRNIYLHTPYWHWLRRKVAKRARLQCEVRGCPRCGWKLNAHHTTYKTPWGTSILFWEWLFMRKMVYLCPEHHANTHAGIRLPLRNLQTLEPFGVFKPFNRPPGYEMRTNERVWERNSCIELTILFPLVFVCVGILLYLMLYLLK